MFNPTFWHWLILACAFLGLEILVPGAFFLWLGLAALASFIVKLIIPGLSWEIQYALFALFSVISLFAWKRFAKMDKPSDQPALNQRNQQLVGRTLILSEAIENGIGRVIADDSQWKVTGPDAPQNSKVKVIAAEGNLLRIELVDS